MNSFAGAASNSLFSTVFTGCRTIAAGIAIVAVSIFATGCSQNAQEAVKDPHARASLDQRTGQIITPISEYDLVDSPEELAVFDRALYLNLSKCMGERGFIFTATMAETRIPDDRDYGIWFEPIAQEYGFGSPPSPVSAAEEMDSELGGEPWEKALDSCYDSSLEDPELKKTQPRQEEFTDSLTIRVHTEAQHAAERDPIWQSARAEWTKCLRAEGLEPIAGENDWSSEEAKSALERGETNSAELIDIATIEAKCNNETRLTQQLADLVAQYELPLIQKNQAALNESKTRKQSLLSAAREYIAWNG